jgi:hypothetical protein
MLGDSPPLDWVKPFYPSAGEDLYFSHTFKAVTPPISPTRLALLPSSKKHTKPTAPPCHSPNKALHSQGTVKKTTSSSRSCFLDLFENLTRNETTCPAAATKHLDGAVALLKFRGGKQFEDPVSLAMFLHLSSVLISSYLERVAPIQKAFLRFRHQASCVACADDPDLSLSNLMIRLASLRASSPAADAEKV